MSIIIIGIVLSYTPEKKNGFGSVSNSLDNQIKKGMLMFIIVAAEANGDGGGVGWGLCLFPKPKTLRSLEA